MRLIVMFDLPTNTALERKYYRQFRKFLVTNGYAMVQYSIYAKIILNHSALQLQKVKLEQNLPPKGHIETLIITEKQYANMERISKGPVKREQITTASRIVEL
ncbi:CRISPR-associated endonuclease Cas2 [Solibacillus sp. FSL H8-0538]|uniref:CRISPR-associated endonuclease Cas2 n=1 Tax=Solibacillus sp. FSL H8-0538 TaxID=2921400 RepID=UPI0030F726ED